MRFVFVEPPKEFWFVMGEYLPPPMAAIQLAAYLEAERPGDEIAVIDCQAEGLDSRARSLSRQLRGIFSLNRFKRRTYRYLASQKLLRHLRGLI